jgi:membrane protease YdiL (CAAX protease family)
MLQNKTTPNQIKPLSFFHSVLLFAVPAAVMFLSYHYLMPLFTRIGLTPLESFLTAHILPMALMFGAAIVGYAKVEGNPMTMSAFRERFRLPRLTFKAFAIGLGVFILTNIGYGAFSQLSLILIGNGTISLPANVPPIADPHIGFTAEALSQMNGAPIAGNWGIALVYLVMLVFNVIGEEFWWRGYILPRQELTHGRWTWLIHGLLWTGFHAFKWWDLIGLLPVCLLIAYFAQKTKSTTVTIITHFLFNGMAFALLIGAITGVI